MNQRDNVGEPPFMAINVGPGNRPDDPEPLARHRPYWRVTWLALIGLVLFALVFAFVGRIRSSMEPGVPAPGTRTGQERPDARPRP